MFPFINLRSNSWCVNMGIGIRKLHPSEYDEARSLAVKVFDKFEAPMYPQEGKDEFHHFIWDVSPEMTMQWFGAFDGDKMVGTVVVREPQHITLLFVLPEYHRLGEGRV